MNRTKAIAFLFVFIVPALMPVAAHLGTIGHAVNAMTWFPLVFLFVLVPVADFAFGHDPKNVPISQEKVVALNPWFKALTLTVLPVHLLILLWSCHWFVHAPLDPFGIAGWLLSQGVVSSILAINTAHELIHKDGRLEPLFGGILLASVGYHGFKIEHLRGHHVHVATPEDASSAQLGQSLWHFLPRALFRNTRNAWRLESERLRKRGLRSWSRHNEMLVWTALWLSFIAAFSYWLGVLGALFFLSQGLIAAISLEIINYVEHYGLERRLINGHYERTTHLHSWNSDYALSNLMLFQLQRHSDHHAFPKRRYSVLRHHIDSPQLPGGYPVMFVLALCPLLWRKIIDPRVRAFQRTTSATEIV